MNMGSWAIFLVFGGIVGGFVSVSSGELIELSYTYGVDAPTSPKLKPFEYTIVKNGSDILGNGIWVYMNEFCTSEHSGTHMDAPLHFARDRWSIDQIPLDRLYRVPAVMIDMREAIRNSGQTNYRFTAEDLEEGAKKIGGIPDGGAVFVKTGWGEKVHDLSAYSGLDSNKKNNFPGLSKEAAEWIVSYGNLHGQRVGVVGYGVDAISVDVGNSSDYIAHRTMYSHNIYGLENVANVHKLPATGFRVTVLPMRLGGGSGAPTRIVAEVPEKGHNPRKQALYESSSAFPSPSTYIILILAALTHLG